MYRKTGKKEKSESSCAFFFFIRLIELVCRGRFSGDLGIFGDFGDTLDSQSCRIQCRISSRYVEGLAWSCVGLRMVPAVPLMEAIFRRKHKLLPSQAASKTYAVCIDNVRASCCKRCFIIDTSSFSSSSCSWRNLEVSVFEPLGNNRKNGFIV